MNCRIDSRARISFDVMERKVEDNADRNRRVFAGKGPDLLLLGVFEHLKVILLQAGHQRFMGR